MADIGWGELKPASEAINKLLIKFRSDATSLGIHSQEITVYLTTIMHLIINAGGEAELENSLREKLSEWKRMRSSSVIHD